MDPSSGALSLPYKAGQCGLWGHCREVQRPPCWELIGSIEKGGCARDSPKALVSPFWPNGHGSLLHMNQKTVNLRRMDLKLDSSGTPTVCGVWGGAQP